MAAMVTPDEDERRNRTEEYLCNIFLWKNQKYKFKFIRRRSFSIYMCILRISFGQY